MRAETITIKQADANDTSVVSHIIRDSFRDVAERFSLTPENCPKHPSNCTDEWIRGDIARGVTYYVLEHGNVFAGCVALETATPDLSYLERLAVLPDMRRKGFGRALVEHLFLRARASGAQTVGIGMISDESELKQWYKNLGFIEGDTKEFTHLPFRVTFMTYELQGSSITGG